MGLKLASLFALGLALSCASEIKKGRTQNHGHYVCSTWGNNHFKTFDGDFYQFPGLCDYNFASDCREAYKEFSVHIQRDTSQNGHPEIQYVLITIKDVVIYLTQHTAVVDEQVVKTPYYSSGLLIESTEVYTKVYARAGLILMWNRKDALMLELDSKFNNNTCGLCGDYNGLQVYNEFISNGMSFNPITFGNMQKINKPGAVCEDPDETTTIATCNEHRDECLRLLTSSEFSDCVSRLNLDMYVEACMQDKCACHGTEDSFCLCSTISEFSRQCSHAGGQPGNWRTDKFCSMTCPGNMIYQESSSPCINTCSHLEVSSLCEEHHMDGCFCPEGTVYDDVNGKGCVSVSECYCKQHGVVYSPGQTITNECEECTCDSGRWLCNNLPCPGSCLLEGGAHITTFDKKKYTFHGDCFYVLSKGGVNDSHALLAELSSCGATDKQTCLKSVVLLIDQKKNSLTIRSDGTVLLNDMVVNLPHVTASFSVFQPSSYHIIVRTHFGLKLQIQLVPIMQLFVIVGQNVQGKLQGLCGNFNGMAGDDFKTPGGLVEATGSAFANTWKAQPTCRDQVDRLEDPCALSVENENYAEFWCSQLKNSESVFARCHSVIDATEYYKRCKYDTCSCSNNEECLCAALSSYVRACAFKGIMLGGWRQNVCNKEVSSCPASQVFLYNLTTCQHTCRSLADGQNQCVKGFIPVDGCGCPGNTYMNEKGKCVHISQCSCYHKGTYLEPGDVIFKQEERCVCRNAVLHCTQVKITGEKCPSPKIHLDCSNVNSRSSPVLPQLSCHSLGAGYLPTECVSGCICPYGLFDDGRGGCVRENDCPCTHNGEFYPPGHTLTVECNNCTCYKGKWNCTMNECYGTCIIYGSGHYVTFDEKHYDFDGHCEYVAAQDYCGEDPSGTFSIITVNVPCGTTGVTCSKAIKVFFTGIELKLEDKHYVEIHRNASEHMHYWTRTVGLYLVIEASNGVMLIWDKKTTIFVKLTPNYKGKICGLCGNFDDSSNNDFTTRDGLQVSNPLEFGNSWKSSASCPDVVNEILPCSLKPHRKSWAEKECSIILSRVFEGCRSKVDPRPFYENCVHDACSCDTGGDCECFCSAVAAYAQECIKHGACVHWRTPDICPIFCDYYNHYNECTWHYKPCGHHIATCRIISNANTNFPLPYLEGCYPRCPEDKPIYDEDGQICVTEDKCGCYMENGTRYEPGQEVPSYDPCKKCICVSTGNVSCSIRDECRTTTPQTTTTTTTTPPTTTTTTTPTTTTSVPTSTTPTVSTTSSSPTTTPCTTNPVTVCWWSDWIDVSYPDFIKNTGDYETYPNIRKWNASAICDQPVDIECRAEKYPDSPIADLQQIVTCDVSTGLVCNNKDQTPGPFMPVKKCLNYQIRVKCCNITCEISTTTTTTTTSKTTPPSTTTTTETTTPTTTTTTTTTTTETTTPSTTTPTTTTTETTTPSTTTPTTTSTTTTETTTPLTTTPTTTSTTTTTEITTTSTPTTTETPTPSTTTSTTTTTETPTPSTTTPTITTTTTTETPTPLTTTPIITTTTTETPTPSTTTSTTTTTETPTPSTTTPTITTTTTETPTPSTATPTTTTTTTKTPTPSTTYTTTTTETPTPSTTTPTITTTTTTETPTPSTTPIITTTTTETPTPSTTTSTTTTTETPTPSTTTPTITTTTTETPTPSTTTPTTTTTETPTPSTTTPIITTTTTETPTPSTTTPTTTTTETPTPSTTTPIITTTTTETPTPSTTSTTTTTETPTPSTTTPIITTTTTETPTPSTTSTTTTTETPTPSTTTPIITTTTTETPTPLTTTSTTTTTTETPTPSTTTPTTTTTTTTETPTPSTTTPTTTTTETPTPSTTTPTTTTTTTTETPTPSTTTSTTTTTTTTETPTPSTTTSITTTTETPTPSTTTPTITTTTTTETPTPSTTTPIITTTTETPTPSTTTTTTTTTETPTPSTATPATTTTTETPTPSTTPLTSTTTTKTTTPSTTTSTTTETTTSLTTTPTTTTTATTTSATSTPETTTSTPTTTTTTTTTTSTPTTTPGTTTPITTTPGTTEPTTTCTTTTMTSPPPSGCLLPNNTFIPPGASYWPCNCTEAICKNNNTWVLNTTVCEDVPKPNCSNGLTPVQVWDECCWHWECDCFCSGWGDPHYVTFDGQYYSYQGNCTYVLVEEIHKNIDNFGVYIDNYHCDARETVSCPRTLIVKYETQEVHVKTLKMFPFIIQVKVNGQEVATPYEKYGMKVFKSGVNYIVEIERIGVNVSYNGLSFSVRLSYHLFGNNTQGQCGTCNNNKTDDCMLPNGKFPDSCETMADHWVVHDPEKPQCTPSVIPTQGPPLVPDTCKPSALCELFKGSVFEKCHRLVDYHNYYRACIYDSCFVPNSQLECASLQIYATICADQGACVDWRGYTHGTCALKCPSHRVYKACGPIEEVTCKSSQVALNHTNHMEGCFCPDGTMPYGGGVDVCVETCGCVGPDNKPRKFGERFEFDCNDCICLEGGSGIQCEPLKCPEKVNKTNCKNEGFYEVTEVNPDNTCCNKTSCRCDVALCTTIPPKCGLGHQLESSIAPGMCCPVHKCVPKKVCVHDNAEYLPGSPVLGDKCETCMCTENVNSTGQNIVTCHHIPCDTKCPQGYELKDMKGECCPKCVQTKCIVKKSDSTSLILSPGQMQTDPKNNCTVYSCVLIKGQFISSTSEITCPAFSEENCKPGTITLLPNGCCKTCIPQDTPLPCSATKNLEYIIHMGCRSVEKVTLTHCEGSCGTLSIYSAEASSMEHKCSCCRETETIKKEVLLRCPNGETKTYKYLHVNGCKCFDTECTIPGSSEEAKSSEHSKENVEQGAIERVKRAIQRIMQ